MVCNGWLDYAPLANGTYAFPIMPQHMNRIVVALPIRSDPRPDLVASIDKSGQWSARALMRPLRTATNRSTPTGCLTRSQGRPYVSRKALFAGMRQIIGPEPTA
jgi:hypothetical protein